ncbi:long-chain fatty acid-CoA ligase, partial [Coelomomyces lativittatus]
MMIPDLSIFTSSTAWYFIPISTVCFTYFMFKSYYREKNVTVQLPSDDPSTPYPRYRHQKGLTLIQLPQASTSLTSVLDLLNFAKDHHGSKKAFGSRSLIRIHEEEKWVTKKINNQTEEIKEKKTWQFFEKSDYQWWTYHQVFDKAVNLGAGLKRYLPSHSMFCIYANTCVEWQLLAQACFTQSITIVTAYE